MDVKHESGNMISIKYEDFKTAMNEIVKLRSFEDKLHDLCREMYDIFDCELSFPTMIDTVVLLLKIATNDTDEWIDYWVYELDCGKDYTEGAVRYTDGEIIPLATVDDLWAILNETANNNSKNI